MCGPSNPIVYTKFSSLAESQACNFSADQLISLFLGGFLGCAFEKWKKTVQVLALPGTFLYF